MATRRLSSLRPGRYHHLVHRISAWNRFSDAKTWFSDVAVRLSPRRLYANAALVSRTTRTIPPSRAPHLHLELLQRRISVVRRRRVQRHIAVSGNARNHAPRYPFNAEERSPCGRFTYQRLSEESHVLDGTRRVGRAHLLETGTRFLNGTELKSAGGIGVETARLWVELHLLVSRKPKEDPRALL